LNTNLKTFNIKKKNIKRNWIFIDASKKPLGRLSTEISFYLLGKNKPEYSPHIDCGDYVVIINAEKVFVTGNKNKKKIYYRNTGYIGNMKKFTFLDILNKNPKKIIEISVKGMLPKNSLGRSIFKKLKIYNDNIHPYGIYEKIQKKQDKLNE